jgi:hypothetical protein
MQVSYRTSDGTYGRGTAGFIDHALIFTEDKRLDEIVLIGGQSEKAVSASILTFVVRNVEDFTYTENSS